MGAAKPGSSSLTWLHLVGGGVANLHLADQLARVPKLPGTVVISEPKHAPLSGQTLCGFARRGQVMAHRPSHRWNNWGFGHDGRQHRHQSSDWEYLRFVGADVAQSVIQRLVAHPQIEWRREALTQAPRADWVLDGRPPPLSSFQAFQSFVGYEVPAQVGESLLLMDDIQADESGISFVYRLPLGDRTLIELTRFENQPTDLSKLERALQAHVAGRECLYREAAVIPMGVRCDDHWGVPVGARGGFARASTGYSFLASMQWAEHAAASLLQGRVPSAPYSALERWMDQVFLRVLRDRPDQLAQGLFQIARGLSGDRFAAFMAGGSWPAALQMIGSAPKMPFIQAALR